MGHADSAASRCLCAERGLLGVHEEPCAGFGSRSDELCEQAEREAVAAGEWPPESPAASMVQREVASVMKALAPMGGTPEQSDACIALGRLAAWAEAGLTPRYVIGEAKSRV